MRKRASGVLLHVTSLPSVYGIGDLGHWAFKFADLLSETGQSYWQVLPLTPTTTFNGNSPYIASSGFAGNTLLISPGLLAEEKLLPGFDVSDLPDLPSKKVDFEAVTAIKNEMIKKAHERFRENFKDYSAEFETFCANNSKWLDDYALYKVLKEKINKPWYLWESDLRDRKKAALEEKKKSLGYLVEREKFAQFVFFRQWRSLREHCTKKGLKIIGDIPFYPGLDSADVWVHPEIFKLDHDKKPAFVAGVPPDYFSESGQLWGNPVYDWDQLSKTNFEWWMNRIDHSLKLVDVLRLDHFRGFLAYWEVPADAKKALNGKWVRTSSDEFFLTLARFFPAMPFIAEDLGFITDDVVEAMNRYSIPGMEVLLFAFSGSQDNPYLPHNHSQNSVSVTGTHDTNTARGWFVEEATPVERNSLFKYVGRKLSEEEVSFELIRLAMMSVACLSIIPLQDVLSLEGEARMNHPATCSNNWEWRVTAEQLKGDELQRFGEMAEIYGRRKNRV